MEKIKIYSATRVAIGELITHVKKKNIIAA
jgi:hypothetical protein